MRMTRVLVLGNSSQINEIDFSRLRSDVLTLGVNRIWLKHIPNYFFFNDYEIIKELESSPENLAKLVSSSRIYSSDWLRTKNRQIPSWVRVFERHNKLSFPDSVTTSLRLFSNHFNVNDKKNTTYYIAGVDLQWSNTSHFWKSLDYDSLNTHGESWYSARFNKMFNNFKELKSQGFNIVSVNPNSRLNKICRYENIENLYSKR